VKIAFYIPSPSFSDRNTTPCLGPLYLAAVLEQHGFKVKVFDNRIDKYALDKLLTFTPDIVGISTVTFSYLTGLKAAKKIKKIFPNVLIVFGGAHASILPKEVISKKWVDYVFIGESEKTFLQFCELVKNKEDSVKMLKKIKGLAFKIDNSIMINKRGPYLSSKDLENLPWPAFHLMNLDAYFHSTQTHGLFKRGKRILPIMSTRGCPFSCTFCCRTMGNQIRSRSIESVISEIKFLVKRYGVDEIYFEDDNFTVQRERALELLARIAALKPSIYLKFANGVRADLVDKEILKAMKQAGVYSISFGIESGSPKTLQKMKKNLDLDKARKNIFLAKSMGFLVGSNCIIGYPNETVKDIEKSLNFFFSLPLDSMAIVNLVPFPGTAVRKLCEKYGYLTKEAKNWDNYFFSLNNPIPLVETRALPKKELIRLIHKAYRRMYLRPRWLLTNFRNLSFREIITGINILFKFDKFKRMLK